MSAAFFYDAVHFMAVAVEVVEVADCGIVGYCSTFENKRKPSTLVLEGLGVSEKWRREGVGSTLVRSSLAVAKKHNFATVELVTAEENSAARQLYAAHKFKEVELLTNYFGDGFDRLLMRRGVR
ncbi:MAG: GNAT family N-acetyltransferase [Pseudomonadota bacterium]